MNIGQRLAAAAAIRSEVLDIEGEKVVIKEAGTIEFSRYAKLSDTDRAAAIAVLLVACVFDEDGVTPVFDEKTANEVAKSARVTMPLVSKIMQLGGFEKEDGKEKHSVAS